MSEQTVTPIVPTAPAEATPPVPTPATPDGTEKPQIEVKDGTAKELAERLKMRRELEAARKEAAEYKSKYETLKPWEERSATAKKAPLKFIREAGLEWNDLTEAVLRGDDDGARPEPELSPVEKQLAEAQRELQELKAWREQEQSARRQAEEAKQAEAFSAYENEAKSLLTADKYPHAFASEDTPEDVINTVVAVRNQHWSNTCERDASGKITKRGEVLSAEQALQKVEDYWRAKFSRAPGKPQQPGQAPAAPAKQSARSAQPEPKPQPITNQLTPPATQPPQELPALSRQEILEQSIERLKAKRAAAKQAAPQPH